MKINFKKEVFYLLVSAIPYLYLSFIYKGLPDTVPTHFGIHGEINGWSSRASLWFIPASLTILISFLFLILPIIDPKRRLNSNSGKFEHIRFIVVIFIAGLSCFCLYISKTQHVEHLSKFMFAFLGLFFATLGNFFPSLKPNYFIGIRSPWALENEMVWKRTHQMAGKLWVAGGILLMILAFIMPDNRTLGKVVLPLLIFISIVPVLYSYMIWRKVKKNNKVHQSL